MLPGKKYTAEDALRIIRRRHWVLLVPFAVISAATALVARRLPDTYVSTATIVVVPPQVPESLVKQTVNTRLDGRLQAIQQQVLSRTRLEKIIEDFNLYARERRTGLMEDIVERMRRDTVIQVVKGDAFQVSYFGSDPKTVQKVAQRVASLFIDQNLRDRATLAEGTNQFLEVQLDDARRRLIEQEKRLEAYREKYAGQLPSQAQSNLQALQNVQMQIQSTLEARNRGGDQRLLIQRELADVQANATVAATTTDGRATRAAPEDGAAIGGGDLSTVQQLESAKNLVKALEIRYKPGMPDLDKAKRLVDDLQAKVDAEALTRPVSGSMAADATVNPAERQRQQRIANLQAQIAQIDTRLTANQNDETNLRTRAADYQQKIDGVPARESEMTELTRDYGVLQSTYASLLQRKEEANISANLEKQQIGEQFTVVDDAQIPERPVSPNRPAISLGGIAGGLVVGLVVIALLEYRATGFQTDDDVTRLLGLPVLAVVPVMESRTEHKRKIRFRLLANLGLTTAVAGCLAVLAYTFVR